MKLLMTLSRIPYPLQKGDKLRAYHQIKSFVEQGIDLTVVCFHFETITPEQRHHLESIAAHWHFIPLEKWRVPFQYLKIFWTRLPLQVILFYNKKAHQQFREILYKVNPDHLYAQLIRTTEYVKEETAFDKTLDYMDAFSTGLKRRSAHAPWYLRWLFEWEQDRVLHYEHGVYHYFDHHTIISRSDEKSLNLPHPVDIVSNGIDQSFLNINHPNALPNNIVFTGNMSYPPNIEAAIRLGKRIMPLVWERYPDVQLFIAGDEPHKSLYSKLNDERIVITGWLSDIKEAYQKGRIFVAPMTLGSGMQNKIIEALAMGNVIVCSDLVAQAFDHEVQSLLNIQTEDIGFANAIMAHLSANTLVDTKHNQQIVKKHFSWTETSTQLLRLFQS